MRGASISVQPTTLQSGVVLRLRGRVTICRSATRALHAVSTPRRTTLLVILDGFGHRSASEDNAILAARTPTLDRLWQEAPHTLVSGSGLDVGLPDGQMGNSEVGHMSLGAGRIVYQSITRIDQAITSGDLRPTACIWMPSITLWLPIKRSISWACYPPAAFTVMKNSCSRH